MLYYTFIIVCIELKHVFVCVLVFHCCLASLMMLYNIFVLLVQMHATNFICNILLSNYILYHKYIPQFYHI